MLSHHSTTWICQFPWTPCKTMTPQQLKLRWRISWQIIYTKIGAGIHSQTPQGLLTFKGMEPCSLLRAELLIKDSSMRLLDKTSMTTATRNSLGSVLEFQISKCIFILSARQNIYFLSFLMVGPISSPFSKHSLVFSSTSYRS